MQTGMPACKGRRVFAQAGLATQTGEEFHGVVVQEGDHARMDEGNEACAIRKEASGTAAVARNFGEGLCMQRVMAANSQVGRGCDHKIHCEIFPSGTGGREIRAFGVIPRRYQLFSPDCPASLAEENTPSISESIVSVHAWSKGAREDMMGKPAQRVGASRAGKGVLAVVTGAKEGEPAMHGCGKTKGTAE